MILGELKRGTRFLHRNWTEGHGGPPLRCVVTKTAGELVYWKAHDGGASYYFYRRETDKYVKEIIKEDADA